MANSFVHKLALYSCFTKPAEALTMYGDSMLRWSMRDGTMVFMMEAAHMRAPTWPADVGGVGRTVPAASHGSTGWRKGYKLAVRS